MRIDLLIGPDIGPTERLLRVLTACRRRLRAEGVIVTRAEAGLLGAPGERDTLTRQIAQQLAVEQPKVLILAMPELASGLATPDGIMDLRERLTPLSEQIRVLAWLDDPARMLLRAYETQLQEGRDTGLDHELALLTAPSFRDAEIAGKSPCFWLDFRGLQAEWETAFGAGSVIFRSIDPRRLHGEKATEELRDAFDLAATPGKARPEAPPEPPSAAWLARCRLMNEALNRWQARGERLLPGPLRRRILQDLGIGGPPTDPGSLQALSARFAGDIAELCRAHPGLDPVHLAPDPPAPAWEEADPGQGFRATQYLMALRWRLERAAKTAPQSSEAGAHLPPAAQEAFVRLKGSVFAPHNRLGSLDEEAQAVPYAPAPRRPPPEGDNGTVLIACMKNEAPFILEWIAYHRAIGVDHFLIYSNDCEDGTDALLDRLQSLGLVLHRDNSSWTGNSPQQHALDRALTEPLVQAASWLAHIDVDEFINLRCGNGTLEDLFARVPDATHIAMTWRLFGHDGVTTLEDRPVLEQFETCAPRYCPKPHTVWGFKTLFRNLGAYRRLSCHRPKGLVPGVGVTWVNGSGQDVTPELLRSGWRNSRRSIGYDLVQLNHYALRSAESYLVKRQRGRALHVDRAIGLNYWIRMDWSDARDLTIRRNLPRMRTERARLMADPELARLHEAGFAWHRERARALRADPEYEALFQQVTRLRLGATERAAYALCLDMES